KVCVDPTVFGRKTHWSRSLFVHGVVDDALRKKSPCANGVNVGVRAGSAVTMWSSFSSTGSAIATNRSALPSLGWSGSVTCMSDIARSSTRAFAASVAALPVLLMYTFGAMSEWTLKVVVALVPWLALYVATSLFRSPLTSV